MLKTFDDIFPSYPRWNAPHHMGFLDSRVVTFTTDDRRGTRFMGLRETQNTYGEMLEAARSWPDWVEVPIATQDTVDTDQSFAFKNKKTGGYFFVYRYDFIDGPAFDLVYVDGKHKAAIRKFLEYGCRYAHFVS